MSHWDELLGLILREKIGELIHSDSGLRNFVLKLYDRKDIRGSGENV